MDALLQLMSCFLNAIMYMILIYYFLPFKLQFKEITILFTILSTNMFLINKVGNYGVIFLLISVSIYLMFIRKNRFINTILANFGIGPLKLLYNDFAVLLGMVYNFLPFMILPIYTVLVKMDTDLINAASDLGATKSTIFRKIIFPLSMPGVISGITMVFMPAVSTFVISRILGGGQYMLLGNLIQTQYTTMGDWNFGSAIAIFMMIIILISMAFMNKFEGSDDKEGGSRLW